eukprot:2554225-Prymnesium_polylepis.1
MLVIPEVQQLMKRQLAKGAKVERQPSQTTQAQLLHDVAAWLTLNSMRTERVQFDQLCAQNLATLWRQNAWSQLLGGHQHFKVRPDQVQGFVHERLGEAYMSNRLGRVSREHLANKSLVLYFEGRTNNDDDLMRALQQAYKSFGCEDGMGHFEIIYITAQETPEQFAANFRHMPWLSLPFTHALRREQLRLLFEVNESHDAVVLLHMDGSTITRDGKHHVKLAYKCQSSIDDKKHDNEYQKELKKAADKERKHLKTLEARLKVGVEKRLQEMADQLCAQARVKEFDEFLAEQAELPAEVQEELDEAVRDVDGAREAIRALDADDLEERRLLQDTPSDELRESVEAVAVIFGSRPEFSSAQARLMPKENALREKLLAFDNGHVPASAHTKLRKFLAGGATVPLAATLRQWVTALVRFQGAHADAEM